ncbi:MAG: acyl carrier protein [Desulfobacteraceae bacterium]|nr:MAG: acyl carrier protein [Desulfobacteraceae bacterium]
MKRDEIQSRILRIFKEQFEINDPGLDEDLRELYEFDSIDAIELLREIEVMLGFKLTREDKKRAMDIRTINHILDYIDSLRAGRVEQA